MTCLICLEELDNKPFKIEDCNCTLSIHRSCYENFLQKTTLACPICRIPKRRNAFNNKLMNLVFKLPAPLGLFVWVFISFLFSCLVAPLLIMRLSIGNNMAWPLYFVYLYSIYFGINTLIIDN